MSRLLLASVTTAMIPFGWGDLALADASSGSQVLSSQGGRYVFGQVSSYRRDQYMLDAETGRLWRMTCVSHESKTDAKATGPGECGLTVLDPVPYTDGADYNVMPPPVPRNAPGR